MSSIGRILIVVNLGLAAAFLGWASQVIKAGQNYKADFEEEQAAHEATRTELETQLSRVNAENQANREQLSSEQQKSDGVQAQLNATNSQLTDAESDNDELRNNLAGLTEQLQSLASSVDSAEERAATAASEARDAVLAREEADDAAAAAEIARRDAVDEARRLTQDLSEANSQIASLTDELGITTSNLETVAQLTGFNLGALVDTPVVNSVVADVRLDLDPGFVAISAGSEDGIGRGMVFDIYSGATYKGQVRVEDVTGRMCTAVITTNVDGAPITIGDSATTAL